MIVTHKPFDDPSVRLACRLAVNPAKASAVTHGPFSTPAEHHPVSQVHPEYAKLAPWRHDPARAKALLAEAGYPEGVDVELTIQQNPPHHLRHATALAQIGRASCRERVCQYGVDLGGRRTIKKKKTKTL